MKANLTLATSMPLYHCLSDGTKVMGPSSGLCGNVSGLWGDVTSLCGNVSGLRGDVTGLWGNVSGLCGDVDDCEITVEERAAGIDVKFLAV